MKLATGELRSAKIGHLKMKRVFYDFNDYQLRLDASSACHYDIELEKRDAEGLEWVQRYKIYGMDRRGNLIVFERRWAHASDQARFRPLMADMFVNACAKPLNAVPGRLEIVG